MRRIFLLILCILILLFFSTTSTPQIGLEHYYFVIALGLDKLENDFLKITVQLSTSKDDTSSSSGSSQSSKYEVFSVEAKTINEGLTVLNNYLNKKLNLSHCSSIIISEELAKDGIKEYFNTLSNNTELRHSALVLVSSSTSYDLIKSVSNSGEAFASRLYDHFTTSIDYTGFSFKSTFGDFFEAMNNKSKSPITLYVSQNGEMNQTSGIAIFKDEKLASITSITDSIAHLILTNNLEKTNVRLNNPFNNNEHIDLELSLYKKTSINVDFINNTPCIIANIYPEGKILSSGSTFNYTNINNVNKIEDITNTYVNTLCNNYFNLLLSLDCDTIGFAEIYKSKLLFESDFNNSYWNDNYKKSIFNSKVNAKINSSNLFNKE